MIIEQTALRTEDRLGSDIVELSPHELEQISGGLAWFAAIPLGWKIAGAIVGTGAAGFGAGAAAGYFANR